MWRAVAVTLLVVGCDRTTPDGAELTHAQCADLVRRVQRIQSDDTSGMRLTLEVGLRPGVEGCLEKGTDRAYRCVLEAESVKDLEPCNALFK